jgi:diaminopropionate ammonia-lyase
MRLLASNEPSIEAGESAVAGLAAAIAGRQDPQMAAELGLDESSLIFVIGTEGATDPELYRQLLSKQ